MATTVTQEFYNGKEWILITSEILYNEKGEPTGHYKEISREYITKLGILDDETILNQVKTDIMTVGNTAPNSYYIIFGNNQHELYQTYQYGYWDSISNAVIEFFRKNNFIIESYEMNQTFITFVCYMRPKYDDKFNVIFQGADIITERVP